MKQDGSGSHSPKVLKSWQEVYDLYDKLKNGLHPDQRDHINKSYFTTQIAKETGYSESRVNQLLTNRYRQKK